MSARTGFIRTTRQIVVCVTIGLAGSGPSYAGLPWGTGTRLPSQIFLDRDPAKPTRLHDALDFPGPMSNVYPMCAGIVFSCKDGVVNADERYLVLTKGTDPSATKYEYWHLDNGFSATILDGNGNAIDCTSYDPYQNPIYVYTNWEVGAITESNHLHLGVWNDGEGVFRQFPGRQFPDLISCCSALDTDAPREILMRPAVSCPRDTVYEGEAIELTLCIEDVSGGQSVGVNRITLEDTGTSQPILNNTVDLTDYAVALDSPPSKFYVDNPDPRCRTFAYVVPGPAYHRHELKVTASDYRGNQFETSCAPTLITRSITSISATARQADVRVSWHAMDFDPLVSFEILRSDDGGLTYSSCGSVTSWGDGDYEFIDTGVQYKKTSCYMIRDNEGGPGPDPDWGPVESSGRPANLPDPPALTCQPVLTVMNVGSGTVTLQITSGCSPCEGYGVCYSTSPDGPWCATGRSGPGCSNQVVVDGLEEGVDYWFRARAICFDDLGPLSQIPRHGRTLAAPEMTIASCSGGYLYAGWEGVQGSSGYVFHYQRMPGYPVVSVPTTNNYVAVPGLEWDARYCMWVRGVDSEGNKTGPSVVFCSDTGTAATSVWGDSAAAQSGEPTCEVLGNPTYGRAQVLLRGWRGGARRLVVYDAGGRVVREIDLADRGCSELCRVDWDGEDSGGRAVPHGVYFVVVRGGGRADTKKIVLLR